MGEQIIKPWPNTYTITKNLAERTLRKLRGSVPLYVLRPSIIISSYKEPFPGWIDAMTAAGPMTLLTGTGVMTRLIKKGADEIRADMVPVDFVSNQIIVGTVHQANKDSMLIAHSNTSHLNPVTWEGYLQAVLEYLKKNPF